MVNDPLFVWISDRTSSRFGKRLAYTILGVLPLLIWYPITRARHADMRRQLEAVEV